MCVNFVFSKSVARNYVSHCVLEPFPVVSTMLGIILKEMMGWRWKLIYWGPLLNGKHCASFIYIMLLNPYNIFVESLSLYYIWE